MIHHLKGVLTHKRESSAVIEVAGVGFDVWIPLMTYNALPKVGDSCTLYTHMLVREDDIRLYGFAAPEERELFRLFLSLQGVGAKMAMDILSYVSQEQLVKTVQHNDTALLCQVPGVGKKRAEKILFELQRVNTPILQVPIEPLRPASHDGAVPAGSHAHEAVAALMALGMKMPDAQKAVAAAENLIGREAEVSELIKAALRSR